MEQMVYALNYHFILQTYPQDANKHARKKKSPGCSLADIYVSHNWPTSLEPTAALMVAIFLSSHHNGNSSPHGQRESTAQLSPGPGADGHASSSTVQIPFFFFFVSFPHNDDVMSERKLR